MSLDSFSLKGKVAIVTGCDAGLGQAMTVALARAGCNIVGVSRRTPDETQALVESAGRRFEAVKADLSTIEPIPFIVDEALRAFGHIDVLINNAGIIRRENALEFSEQDWDDVLDVNLKSVFFLSQAVARHCVAEQRGGKIINIASMLSFQGGIRVPSYTAAKSGLMGLTKALANEWAPHGINVNAIAPGYMATNNTAALRADKQRNADILARIPAGRWGRADDLAGPVVFLASSASDYMHGCTLAVDGGWLAR
ncbi:2-deoxy-D-gluconate 3-dehydrogenase [Pseudomonas duriflava]|uniref:2-dehydro-3-deoxy-D-gluconate 5-dehydrogenase n=1 Tax=Pseudomonas duriflava TaxID=459528 RepID=A0A562QC49_9PSED|nr:2-dehydro-3-deoxy-D-gluconate 5-dehydrogenase KduD [Pseudomonas duriflava]TWI54289.1 2-deoxy-D-gluconate 3-dehydrogenase [Pseudomonas duriflava]